MERPPGVTVISALALAGAGFLGVTGALAAAGRAPLATGAPLLQGYEQMGPAAFFIAAAMMAATATGLWKLQRWARRAAIVLAAWILWNAVPGVSSATADLRLKSLAAQGSAIIASVVAIRYLMTASVRSSFEVSTSGPRTP